MPEVNNSTPSLMPKSTSGHALGSASASEGAGKRRSIQRGNGSRSRPSSRVNDSQNEPIRYKSLETVLPKSSALKIKTAIASCRNATSRPPIPSSNNTSVPIQNQWP
jgi:hypothetical protein